MLADLPGSRPPHGRGRVQFSGHAARWCRMPSGGRAARLGLTTWPAPWLCPEPGIAGRVVVKLPHLADAAVPDVKDVRGVLVHPVAAALGELVTQRDRVLVPADHVMESDLDGAARARRQRTEERQDGISPVLRAGPAAASRYVPDCVAGEQLAERRQVPGTERRMPAPDHVRVVLRPHRSLLSPSLTAGQPA